MNKEMELELVHGLQRIYGKMLVRIVLYGSYARGNQTDESDIDIAVLLTTLEDKQKERQMVQFAAALDLKYDKVFSLMDIDYDQYQKWAHAMPFYQNIEREGIALWAAA